jgi:nitroreductase
MGESMISKQDILDAFHFRHACKAFDPRRKISDEDFRFILETGRLSPSSFGFEPWRFLVIQNPTLRENLLAATWGAKGQFPSASHVIAILVRKDDMRPGSAYVEGLMRAVQKRPEEARVRKSAFYKQFHETDFKLQDGRALFDWGCRQAYIALGNMMTAAAMVGIDSCPIEGFNQADAERVLEEAGVMTREKFGLAVMVAFGYRINPQPVKSRQAMEELVQWA